MCGEIFKYLQLVLLYYSVPKTTSIDISIICVCLKVFLLYVKSLMMSFILGTLKHINFLSDVMQYEISMAIYSSVSYWKTDFKIHLQSGSDLHTSLDIERKQKRKIIKFSCFTRIYLINYIVS